MKEKLLLDIYSATTRHTERSLMDDLEISQQRYSGLEKIATGGMKTIFKCADSHTDRKIVLVTPKDASLNELFIREGRINAYLQHPNISPVYDIGLLTEAEPYFTSKLIHGSPLNTINLTGDNDRAVDIVIKICEAVSYAHSRGIVHQDLKPDNIIIDDFGEVIIIDWGLAEIDDSVMAGNDTIMDKEMEKLLLYSIPEEYRKLRGTPGFIAPERYNSNEPRQSNDIYSIGGILFTLLTGNIPEKGAIHFSQNVPPGLKAICEKALHQNSKNRYQKVSEVLSELNKFRHGFATDAEAASPLRLLRLLYARNKRFCQSVFISLVVIISILTISFLMINGSRNTAYREKEKAIEANNRNIKLVEQLKSKEAERLKFMKMSAQSQLIKLNEMLAQKRINEVEPLLNFTLQLDPSSPEVNIFKAQFDFIHFRLESAGKIFSEFGQQNAVSLINSLNTDDLVSLEKKMPEINEILTKDMGYYFAINCVHQFNNMEDKVKIYKWVIYFEHPGMKIIPEVQYSLQNGKRKISLAKQFAVKNCGPIHLLDPQILDLSHTSNMAVFNINRCKNLEELNIANTRFLSLNSIDFKNLKKLNISETILKNLYPEQFPVLEVLNIKGALWKQFNRIREFQNLKELILDTEQAKRLKKFTGLTHLKVTVE